MKAPVCIVAVIILSALTPQMSAIAAVPAANYEMDAAFPSPDKAFSVREYSNADNRQLWVIPRLGDDGYCIARKDLFGYQAVFEISPGGRWLLREQKTSSRAGTVFLYQRGKGIRFTQIEDQLFAKGAWRFLARQPGVSAEKIPTYHQKVEFVEWRDGRYLIIKLSGSNLPSNSSKRWIVDGWRCAFDLADKCFVLLPEMIRKNEGTIYNLSEKNQ